MRSRYCLAFDHRTWWDTYKNYHKQFEIALKPGQDDNNGDRGEAVGWAYKLALEYEIIAPVLISIKSTLQRPHRFEEPLRLLTWIAAALSGTGMLVYSALGGKLGKVQFLFSLTTAISWVFRYALDYQRNLKLSATTALLDQVERSILKLRDFTAAPSSRNRQPVRRLKKTLYDEVPWSVLQD